MFAMSLPTAVFRTRRLTLTLFFALSATWLLLFLLTNNAQTFFTVSGAGGCGDFNEAVQAARPGGSILPMIQTRDTSNLVITRPVRINGGWVPNVNCDEANQKFTSTQAFIQYGFTYTTAGQRTGLESDGSALTIDFDWDTYATYTMAVPTRLVFDNVDLSSYGTPQYGGGIRGVLSRTLRAELYNTQFIDSEVSRDGGGLYLTLENDASLHIENALFERNEASERGGGLFMTLRDNAHLEIRDTFFDRNNTSDGGSGLELHLYDDAVAVLDNVTFAGNRANIINTDGGAGRIYLHDNAQLIIRNSLFDGNDLGGTGRGDALYVEMDGGELVLRNNRFINHSDGSANGVSTVHVVSSGEQDATVQMIGNHFANNNTERDYRFVRDGNGDLDTFVADQQVYLPLLSNNATELDFFGVNIISVTLNDDFAYEVHFDTNYETDNSNYHVHFFFDTVPPEQAGTPGGGPWLIYDGSSPFTQYSFFDRPFGSGGAERICALVANPNHSIRLGSGNCVKLP